MWRAGLSRVTPWLQVVVFVQCRSVWSSQLYVGGAGPLVKMLNITQREFRVMCDRVESSNKSPSRYYDVDKNQHLLPNLRVFKSWGLETDHQKAILRKYPAVAARKVGALEETREVFNESFNLSMEEWRGVVIRRPRLLMQSRERACEALFGLFRKAGLSKEETREMFLTSPALFDYSDLQHVLVCFASLRDIGLNKREFIQILQKCPALIGGNVSENLKPKLRWLQKELRLSWKPMVEDILVQEASMLWKATIPSMKKVHMWLKGQGFTDDQCKKVALNLPEVFLNKKLRELPHMLPLIKNELTKDSLSLSVTM